MGLRLDRRSVLCTPATSADRFAVARDCGADVTLIDLEDSVSPDRKAVASSSAERCFLPAAVAGSAQPLNESAPGGLAPGGRVGVLALRVNSPSGVDGLRDVIAVAEWAFRPAIVLVPKVESARDLEIVAAAQGSVGHSPQVYAVVETPRGITELPAIMRSPQLSGLVFGAADYALETGALHVGGLGWDALLFARSAIATAAAAAEVPAIDSPYFELADLDGLRIEADRARALGYCGKIAIHPRQVPVLNAAFSPSAEEIARARRIATAGKSSGQDVTAADGLMVGTPFVAAAAALLAEVDRPTRVTSARTSADAPAAAGLR